MTASRRIAIAAAPIPRYSLYGEPNRALDPGFIHVETIASRSALHDWTIRSHAHHDLHQILLIAAGDGDMQAESEAWRFDGASLLIAPAGLVHGFRFAAGTRGHIVSFAEVLARPIIRAEPIIGGLLAAARAQRIGRAAAGIDRALRRLAAELARADPLAPLACGALLRLVLVAAARAAGAAGATTSAAPGRELALVARFRAQIEERLGDGWSVAQHALALGVSVSRLRAACALAAGRAPIRIIQDRVLIEARRQLAHGSAPVSAIAYLLGFSDPAYFSRWFARVEGAPPGDYRRRMSR